MLKELLKNIPQTGRIHWIGLRTEKRKPLVSVQKATITEEEGLVKDHYKGKNKKRQVTLIQKEHLDVVSTLLNRENVDPSLTRRNIVVSGLNLFGLKNQQFSLGEVILEGTGFCHPCSRMEKNLGDGGYHAMRGHGGITARVIKGGTINIGDSVKTVTDSSE